MAPTKILDDIPVMYAVFYGNPAENDAFVRLESKLDSLKGRKFYGVYFWEREEYRACVRRQDGDDPEALGLRTATIPGGRYAYRRLKGDYETIIAAIAPTFDALAREHRVDPSRPSVEFYRRHEEFLLYLPVLEG